MEASTSPIDPALRLEDAHLAVADLDRSVDFYTRVVGLTLATQGPDSATLGAGDGAPLLTLIQLERPSAPAPRGAGLFHLAFLHPTREDLADSVRRVTRGGWRFTGASDHGVSEALYLRDPDGLGLELYADRPREQWPRRDDGAAIEMYTAPLDVEDLLGARAERETPLADATSVGHVHLQVADVERSRRFYHQAIGLDVMAALPGAAFLAAGGYHHHLGVNEWNSAGAAPAPATAPGLRLVVVRLSNLGEVLALEQRLADAQAPVSRDGAGALLVEDPDAVAWAIAA